MWCSDKYLQFLAASSHSSGPALGFSRAGPGWGTDGSTIVGTQPQRGTTVIDVAVQLLGMAVLSYFVSRRSSSAEKTRRGEGLHFVAAADVDLAAVCAWFVFGACCWSSNRRLLPASSFSLTLCLVIAFPSPVFLEEL